ncbi:MAG: hypothetical protein JSS43_22795 [Proteobacteria bacterium]|nr:hypothetical protein [Pseudomonadota bacterium]
MAAARGAFKSAYDAGRFADAGAMLREVMNACGGPSGGLSTATLGAIANDLALALHRAGDDRACLDVLLDYDLAQSTPGARLAALPPALQRAMRFNWNLCVPACAGGPSAFDATCASVAAATQTAKMVGGFREAACPLAKDTTAVALPDGSCLALLPSRKPFDYATAQEESARDICPIPALISRRDGQTRTTKLETPARSFLLSPEHCCAPVRLGVDASGRIAATPDDNPPEGCLFGHRTAVMQDIFQLEGGRLRLVRQLSAPWFPQ